MIYDVSTQTNRTVQEKVDDLKRTDQQPRQGYCDSRAALDLLLAMSMGSAFDTTIEILERFGRGSDDGKGAECLESKELEVAD